MNNELPPETEAGEEPKHVCVEDLKWVQMRVPMTVNQFQAMPIQLCADCRREKRSQWRYMPGGIA
jgi:hypothetical protein